jgi:hypothetical protein
MPCPILNFVKNSTSFWNNKIFLVRATNWRVRSRPRGMKRLGGFNCQSRWEMFDVSGAHMYARMYIRNFYHPLCARFNIYARRLNIELSFGRRTLASPLFIPTFLEHREIKRDPHTPKYMKQRVFLHTSCITRQLCSSVCRRCINLVGAGEKDREKTAGTQQMGMDAG